MAVGTPQHTYRGDIRLHARFDSLVLENTRDLIVYVPPSYDCEPMRRYPVLYMQDGQNLFSSATAFLGREWRLDETAQCLTRDGRIEPLIIVGIYNTGEQRIDEYTPTRDGRIGRGGKAPLYLRHIVEEVMPYVNARYRTLRAPAFTGIGGSSLGGLVSLYFALTRPDLFGRVAAMSPSVWWDRGYVIELARALTAKPPLRIWLDMGTREGSGPAGRRAIIESARQMRDSLVAAGWSRRSDLKYLEVSGAEHDEASWGRRADAVLRYLYPAQRLRKGRTSSR